VAERRKAPLLANWFQQIEQARLTNDPTADSADRAKAWYDANSKDGWTYTQQMTDGTTVEHELDPEREAKEHLLNILDGTKEADQTFSYAIGNLHRIADEIDSYLSYKPLSARVQQQKRQVITSFVDATGSKWITDITRPNLRIWLATMAHLRRSTLGLRMVHLQDFWSHLSAKHDWSQPSPFKRLLPPVTTTEQRSIYSDADICRLLEASSGVLRDLILVGMYSGLRIDEIASVDRPTDGIFNVLSAKTASGVRVVPVHSKLVPIVTNSDLFAHGSSNALGTRFSRLKIDLGFDRSYVFHSLRNTFATRLESAGVDELIAARLMGHKLTTMSYGLYSRGPGTDVLRQAIEQVTYEVPD
jgi:integrase